MEGDLSERHYKWTFQAALIGATLVISFQNCGEGFQSFSVSSLGGTVAEPAETDPPDTGTPPPPAPPTPGAPGDYDAMGCPLVYKPGAGFSTLAGQMFDKTRIRIAFGVTAPASYACRTDRVTPYKIDPPERSGTAYTTFLQPLRDHLYRFDTVTTDYARQRGANLAQAQCAMTWILPWAQAGIFTERAGVASEGGAYLSRQGDYERVFHFSAFAIGYALIKDEPGLSAADKQTIETWMTSVGTEINRFTAIRLSKDTDPANNILNWSALSLMSIGLATGNPTFVDRALALYDMGLAQIRSDGYLPLELARGEKAFWYHNYALHPLVLTAEIAKPFGMDLYARGGGRLMLLVDRMVTSFGSFSGFPGYATQASDSNPTYFLTDNSRELEWMEIIYSRFGTAGLKPLLTTARATNSGALKYSYRTHGSPTHLFGVKCL